MLYVLILLPLLLGAGCAFVKEEAIAKAKVPLLAAQAVITVLSIVAAIWMNGTESAVWYMTESLTFSLALDTFGGAVAVLITVCWLLSIPYSSVYMPHSGAQSRYYCFLFLTEAVLLGTVLATDFVTLYLFYELTTLFSAPLVLHELNRNALLGAGKYLYYSVGGAFLALFGLVALYSGGVDLRFTAGGHAVELTPVMLIGVFCVILGFAAKAGLYPLHNWLPAAHPAAPAPASALLSGLIAKAGVIAVVRVLFFTVDLTALRGTWVQTVCVILALVTVFMGSFMGCFEKVLKKRLAYSSISQISYVLLGLFLLSEEALTGSMLQLFFHAAAKIALFQCAGAVILLTGRTRTDELRGLGRKMPWVFIAFALASLSLVGIPPFGGFWSKWYLATAALEALPGFLSYAVPVVLLLSALFTAGYLFAPVISAFFPGEKPTEELHLHGNPNSPALLLSPVLLGGLTGLLGFFPDVMTRLAQSIAGLVF